MNKKKIVVTVIFVLLAVVLNVIIFNYSSDFEGESKSIYVQIDSTEDIVVKLYFCSDGDFREELSLQGTQVDGLGSEGNEQTFHLPLEYAEYMIRCNAPDGEKIVTDIYYQYYFSKVSLLDQCSVSVNEENTTDFRLSGKAILDSINETQHGFQKKMNIVFCVILDLALIIFARYMWNLLRLAKEIVKNRKMIWSLGKNDFKTRFAGSYLGIVWAFIQPIVTILVYWFVFQVGLRSTPVNNFPFVLWLTAGLVPWFFFSESWMSGTGSLIEYSYLVKKVVFNISAIPIVKIISALFVHVFFVAFMLILFMCYGYLPSIHWIQIIYYSFCMVMLVTALSYLSCAIMVFFRDLSQIINIILQVGIWITGIMWSVDMLPEKFRWIMYLNPMYYVVDGYRRALISRGWFWQVPYQTLGFWIFIVALITISVNIFNRLRVHFADVL